jgi:hypothetical protein
MTTETKIPAPLYAAAGAGDYALKQLRKLPAKAAELREKVAAGDLDKLREIAMRNATTLMSNAQVVYADLVKHGAEVVAARSVAVETDAETAQVRAIAEVKPAAAKPVKRQRPATTRK